MSRRFSREAFTSGSTAYETRGAQTANGRKKGLVCTGLSSEGRALGITGHAKTESRFWSGETTRFSPTAPTPTTATSRSEVRRGRAAYATTDRRPAKAERTRAAC